MTEQEFIELAAAAALGALDAEDEGRLAEALREHPEWETILDEELALAAMIGETAVPEAPRSPVKSALMAELDELISGGMKPSALRDEFSHRESSLGAEAQLPGPSGQFLQAEFGITPEQPVPPLSEGAGSDAPALVAEEAEETASSKRRRGTRILATIAIAGLFIGVGAGLFGVLPQPEAEQVTALQQVNQASDAQSASTQVDGGGEAGLSWSASEGKAVLVTDGLPSAPSGHTYELWWVRGDQKIPAGTFDPDTSGGAEVEVLGEMHAGDTVAVTVEVTGGAPDGNPSDMLVFAIPTTPGASA